MQGSTYRHPAAPARAIPAGEEPLVTRAKICAQLRTAIQILEGGEFEDKHILAAEKQVQGALRVLFVARMSRRPNLPAHLNIGQRGREVRA